MSKDMGTDNNFMAWSSKSNFSAVPHKGSKASRTCSSSMPHWSWLTWRTCWRTVIQGEQVLGGKGSEKAYERERRCKIRDPKTKSNNLNSKLYNFNCKITNQTTNFIILNLSFVFPI